MLLKDVCLLLDELENIQILKIENNHFYEVYYGKVINIPNTFNNYNVLKHSLASDLDAEGYPYLIISIYKG